MRVRTTNPEAAELYKKGVDLQIALYMAGGLPDELNSIDRAIIFLIEHKVIPVSVVLPGWEPVDDPSP